MTGEGIFDWLAMGLIQNMPPDQREALWLLWKNKYQRAMNARIARVPAE